MHKLLGDEEDKSLTYVSADPADLVGWLRRQIKLGKSTKGQVMLREKVDRLAEIGVSGWMGPDGFLPGRYRVCHEHNRSAPFFASDLPIYLGAAFGLPLTVLGLRAGTWWVAPGLRSSPPR